MKVDNLIKPDYGDKLNIPDVPDLSGQGVIDNEGFRTATEVPNIELQIQAYNVSILAEYLREQSERANIPAREKALLAKCASDLLK